MGLINITDVQDGDAVNEELFNTRFGLIANLLNGNLDADNLSDGAVTTAKLGSAAVTGEKIDSYKANFQADTTNSSLTDLVREIGWGYKAGDGSSSVITETVTFGTSFAHPPIVTAVSLGHISSAVTDITSFTAVAGSAQFVVNIGSITTTGFTVRIFRTNDSAWATTTNAGYAWIAEGRKA